MEPKKSAYVPQSARVERIVRWLFWIATIAITVGVLAYEAIS